MLRLPSQQEITSVYTNHRYRSFSSFVHKKHKSMIFSPPKSDKLSVQKPNDPQEGNRKHHFRHSSADFYSNHNRLSSHSYRKVEFLKVKSESRPESSNKKSNFLFYH